MGESQFKKRKRREFLTFRQKSDTMTGVFLRKTTIGKMKATSITALRRWLARMFGIPAPIDHKEIFRGMARRTSGNVRFRTGHIMFPDEKKAFVEEARKLPPAHKIIEEHFDLRKGVARK